MKRFGKASKDKSEKSRKNKSGKSTKTKSKAKQGFKKFVTKRKFSFKKNLHELLRLQPPLKNKDIEKFFEKESKNKFLEFKCDSGYKLKGQRVLKCVNGKWNGKTPTCVRSSKLYFFLTKGSLPLRAWNMEYSLVLLLIVLLRLALENGKK